MWQATEQSIYRERERVSGQAGRKKKTEKRIPGRLLILLVVEKKTQPVLKLSTSMSPQNLQEGVCACVCMGIGNVCVNGIHEEKTAKTVLLQQV